MIFLNHLIKYFYQIYYFFIKKQSNSKTKRKGKNVKERRF